MKTIIHVHQQVIRQNIKHGQGEHPLTVKTFSGSVRSKPLRSCRASEVFIAGPSRVVYSLERPLSCGARVWIETESEVTVGNSDPMDGAVGPAVSSLPSSDKT